MLESLVTARGKTPELLGPRCAVVPKIAIVNDKGQLCRVYFLHDVGKLFFVPSVIRHVADQREFESGSLRCSFLLTGDAAGKEEHEGRNNQDRLQSRRRTRFQRASSSVSHSDLL